MKTNNTAVLSLVREINRLDVRSSFAVGRAKNHIDPILDGKFADLAALLKVPTSSVEEAYAKLLSVILLPEPQPVRRMARPLPVEPVAAPRLTLTGVVPVEVEDEECDWSPGVGRTKRVIGYNVTRCVGGVETIEFRPKGSRGAILADWSPSRNVEVAL
jgi:hypothetical protein